MTPVTQGLLEPKERQVTFNSEKESKGKQGEEGGLQYDNKKQTCAFHQLDFIKGLILQALFCKMCLGV